MVSQLLLRDTLDQLGENIQDLFTCYLKIGREAEDELGLSVEYTPDIRLGSSYCVNQV